MVVMGTHHLVALPVPLVAPDRHVDALSARAIRLGLWPAIEVDEAVAAILELAGHDRRLVRAALARIERSLAEEPSAVAYRATGLLVTALVHLDRVPA